MSKNNNKNALISSQAVSFSGPLPPPIHLEHYEKVLPGSAERILKMAEEQSQHRRALEICVIEYGIKNSRRGLIFGFMIGLAGFSIVGYCASLGYTILAGIIAALDLGSLVGVFVYGSKQNKEERLEKERAVQEDK